MVSFLPPYTQAIPSEYTGCRSCEAGVGEKRLCGDERGRRRGREPVENQPCLASERQQRGAAGEGVGDGGGAGARVAGYKVQ